MHISASNIVCHTIRKSRLILSTPTLSWFWTHGPRAEGTRSFMLLVWPKRVRVNLRHPSIHR
jgi:hypothetical protein